MTKHYHTLYHTRFYTRVTETDWVFNITSEHLEKKDKKSRRRLQLCQTFDAFYVRCWLIPVLCGQGVRVNVSVTHPSLAHVQQAADKQLEATNQPGNPKQLSIMSSVTLVLTEWDVVCSCG